MLMRMQTLVALVSPHRISSSRFFQTRLSNPPRIIAFVRYLTFCFLVCSDTNHLQGWKPALGPKKSSSAFMVVWFVDGTILGAEYP